jgi:hypothetical protein
VALNSIQSATSPNQAARDRMMFIWGLMVKGTIGNPVAASAHCTFLHLFRSAYRESETSGHLCRGIENEAYSAAALT